MDIAWNPVVPGGHTAYSFRRRTGGASNSTTCYQAPSNDNKKAEIKLPTGEKRNVLITSALPYVNNVPHLGNIIGCVLSADVYSRYCRLRGYNSLYVCGTDEYGTATERKALEANMTCQEICDKFHAIHRDIYQWFDIDFDHFGRTTNPCQKDIAQNIFLENDKNDNVAEKDVPQLYCNSCSTFLADRYVHGVCPLCDYPDAHGDQCDGCSQLLNAIELKEPKCDICKSTPEVKTSRHLFLKLPKLEEKLKSFVKTSQEGNTWSANSVQVTDTWLRDGLQDRCISRDLKWGTPVPKEGFSDKVFYVWFDAPIGYIAITADYTKDWKQWWHNPENVELVQFMGKDNITFHTVIFPSTLIGTQQNWSLLNRISTTEYLNYENGKFSKSRGTGIFGDQAKETGIPSSVWRYYLLSNRPELSDSVFTWDDLQNKNNNELLKNFGNFVSRSCSFVAKFFNSCIPDFKESLMTDEDHAFVNDISDKIKEYCKVLENTQIKSGVKILMSTSARGNLYLQDNKPWVSFKTDPARCKVVVYLSLCLSKVLGCMCQPYMPATTESIFKQLNINVPYAPFEGNIDTLRMPLDLPQNGQHKIGEPSHLFTEISSDKINSFKIKFGGNSDAPIPPFPCSFIVGQIESLIQHPHESKSDCYVMQVRVLPEENKSDNKSNSNVVDPIEAELKAQGEIVRQLKADKADAEKIDAAVAKLLTLKKKSPNGGKKKKDVKIFVHQVVTAIRNTYTEEELIGKKVVLINNVKTINVKQQKCTAQLILASIKPVKKVKGEEKKEVMPHLVIVPDNVPIGSSVVPKGFRVEPEKNYDFAGKLGKQNIRTNSKGQIIVGDLDGELVAKFDDNEVICIADKFKTDEPPLYVLK